MSAATDLVREVRSAGGELIPLDNGKLRIEAPGPLSEHLMARLRQDKAEVVNFLAYRERLLNGWDAETARLIEWFLTTEPPSESFSLSKGVSILHPQKWWTSLSQDIEQGPSNPRARYGALQNNLRQLADYFSTQSTQNKETA